MAVPDKRYTFDKPRPLTPLGHLIEDYHAGEEERATRNHSHFVETAELIESRKGKDAADRVDSLIASNYSIHHHVWTCESFGEVLDYIIEEMLVPYRIVDYSSPMPGGNEFIFILGKGDHFRHVADRSPSTFDFETILRALHSQVEKGIRIIRQEGVGPFLFRFRKMLVRKLSR